MMQSRVESLYGRNKLWKKFYEDSSLSVRQALNEKLETNFSKLLLSYVITRLERKRFHEVAHSFALCQVTMKWLRFAFFPL